LTIRALGDPKPAGSKVSGVAYRKGEDGQREPVTRGGKIVTFTKDSSGQRGKDWRAVVAEAGEAARAGRDLFTGPLYVEMTFLLRRPKGHYGTGRNAWQLRGSAPAWPAVKPDVLKLARGAEDSLSGVVWTDDSRIVAGPYEKVYARPDEAAGVEVRIWLLPATWAEERASRMVEVPPSLLAPTSVILG
jgi:Holliday junction resolvase RusA-like endonuclease